MNKDQYPLLTNITYLNTAYVGLMSSELAKFRRTHEEDYLSKGGDYYKIKADAKLESIHNNFASFFGLAPDRIFGISNFSSGIRIALSFFSKEMKVMIIDDDYPSLTNAFKEQNFNYTMIAMEPNIEEAIGNKLKSEPIDILALSIVQYTTGLLIDQDFLIQIKNDYPELIIIGDGTQFLGAHEFNFDKSPFDMVIGSGYKWLLSGFGNGILMISQNLQSKLGLALEKIRERFFQGHFNILGLASLDFSLTQLDRYDFKKLIKKKSILSHKAKAELTALGFLPRWVSERYNHSSIFSIKGGELLFQFLQKKNIRCVIRGKGIRISFHFYNTDADLKKLILALKEFKILNGNLSLD